MTATNMCSNFGGFRCPDFVMFRFFVLFFLAVLITENACFCI